MNGRYSSKRISFPGFLIAMAGVLLSCTFSLPSTSSSGGTSDRLLPEPAAGLANLSIYRASLRQDVTGTLNGNRFERHTKIELIRSPADGNYDFNLALQGSDVPSFYLRVMALGSASYTWDSPDGFCHGVYDEQTAEKLIDPTLMLYSITKATKIGSEPINGIASTHYRFDQNSLPLADTKTAASGELWIAEQGGYVTKFILAIQPPAEPGPNGLQAGQNWAYELSGVDEDASIRLPDGCTEVLTDVPVMPDAQFLVRNNGFTSFQTASSAAQVMDFYAKNLSTQGWTNDQELPTGEVNLPFSASFTKGDRNISLHLTVGDPSGVEVTIMLISGTEQAPTSKPGAEPIATPELQPTVEISESDLPEDIPLYPGATGLTKLQDQVVEFQTDDTPEQVDQWYQEQMPLQNWSPLSSTNQQGTIIQVWTKDNRVVTISIIPQGKKTLVMITFPNQ